MDTAWFEMKDVERKDYQKSPFVPLRQVTKKSIGEYAFDGFEEEFYAVTSCAFRVDDRDAAESSDWSDLGLMHSFQGYVDRGRYYPSDEILLEGEKEVHGVPLVLVPEDESDSKTEWHLHQDLVVSLRLRREGDTWVSPAEGYRVAARLTRDDEGEPVSLEVARDYLLDYLTARGMGLWLLTFRQRRAVMEAEPVLPWPDGQTKITRGIHDVLEGWFYPIHEGHGMRFGEQMAVFHMSRTDVDPYDEVPYLGEPTDENIETFSFVTGMTGRKLYFVNSERFRNEWLAPSGFSPRIRGDSDGIHVHFHVDTTGVTQPLTSDVYGKWLWFRPDVVQAMLRFRDGQLSWYSYETGSLSAVLGHSLHFGVNTLGLVNIYAKDVALLPNWQQRIMAAHSVVPEGGVSDELLASQVRVDPANTLAPEEQLIAAVEHLNEVTAQKWGTRVFKLTDDPRHALKSCHRFRVQTETDLFQLAKDVTRVVLEELNLDVLLKHGPPVVKKESKPGTRTALQRAIATQIGEDGARSMMGPLAGLYDLRLNDAHVAADKVASGVNLLGIDQTQPLVQQGAQLLRSTAEALEQVTRVIEEWKDVTGGVSL